MKPTPRLVLAAQLVIAGCIVGGAARAHAQLPFSPETVTDEHVRKAIAAIVEELYARHDDRHHWDPARWNTSTYGSETQSGGYTALAVLALLQAGESYQSPRLRDAVKWLQRKKLVGTYAVALRTAVWAKLPPKFEPELKADTAWLREGFSDAVGGWTYEQKPKTRRKDNSIRQYGALALWEAAKRDQPIEPRFWRGLEGAFLACQREDGGWNYQADSEPSTGSMTAAGLATLFITEDYLHADAAIRLGSRNTRHEQSIDRALRWMDASFSPTENPGSFRDYYYYLYGVERVGIASGIKHFGGHDWFREGAAELIRRLCAWDETTRTMTVHAKVAGRGNASLVRTRHLCFALMFLSRGRVPVAINKLRVNDMRWNNRPRDAANLTRWITRSSETDLSWQIVGVDAEPETWLDAPMLYLASDKAVPWLAGLNVDPRRHQADAREYERARARGDLPADTRGPVLPDSEELRRLRRYLDLGGMLVAVNEGSGRAFADSIERVGMLLYPQYEWRQLPEDHWAYTIHARVAGGKPGLRALSNGVRELIVVCPGTDLAASFQSRTKGDPQHFQLAANLFLYASELNRPRPKLAEHVYAGAIVRAKRRATVVSAMYDGNWNAEPLAIDTFRAYLASEHGIDVRLLIRPLVEIDEPPPDGATWPDLVLVRGTTAHEFTADERQAIRRYVGEGGTILFETVGGIGDFAAGAETMAEALFDATARSLLRDPIVTGEGLDGAEDLARIDYRPYSFEVFGARETTARLRGIQIDGRPAVIFSREDLSHGLLDQPCWGISGYAPHAARSLLANIFRTAVAAD